MDPETAYDTSFVPQGVSADLIATLEGFSRADVDTYAAESQDRAAQGDRQRRFARSVDPGASTSTARSCSTTTSSRAPGTTVESLGGAQAVLRRDRRDGRLRRGRAAEVPLGREDQPRPHARQLLGHRRRRGARADRQRAGRHRPTASPRGRASSSTGVVGTEPTIMLTGPAPSARKALAKAGLTRRRHRPVRGQRGVRRGRPEVHEGPGRPAREGQRQRRRDRARPPARRHRRDDPRHARSTSSSARDLRYGLATLCVGGGMGVATIVERI